MLRAQSNQAASTAAARWAAVALCTLLLTTRQHSARARRPPRSAATSRTRAAASCPARPSRVTNTGTKAVQTAVSDDRGQYLFAGLFPGTYDLKVELSGFKSYERKGVALSPNDTRGIDVRLDVGQQTETITVTAQQEVIQTETGAREGVLSAKQIDNLSVIGRSALELLRILPGVVTDFNQGESVSFGGGGNNTQGYTVNGIRSSGNTVSLDGSSLIDIGSNSGVIVSLNNDMVQEVKVQSSNFAAEYGTGGMNVSGVTKSGTLEVPRRGLRLLARLASSPPTTARTASPARRSRRASISIRAATSAARSAFGDSYTKNRDKLFFFVAFEVQRQQVDSGSRFTRTYTQAMRNGDFSELLANRGSNLNSMPQLRIPQGFPGAGEPAPNNDMRPYITPTRQVLREPLSAAELQRSEQPLQLRLQPARADRTATDFKIAVRLEHQQQHQGLRPHRARDRDGREPARRVVGPVGRRAADAERRRRTSAGRIAGNVVSVLSPSMTNEALVSYSRLTLDNHFKDPSLITQGAGGITFNGIFPAGTTSPYLPTDLLHGWGGSGQVGNLWAAANDVYAHNDALQFSDKLTKLLGAHGLKFGIIARARPEAAELPEQRGRPALVRHRQQHRHRQLGRRHAGRPHRPVRRRARRATGNPPPGEPFGEFRYWNIDAFAQDSWKLQPNLTLEYGVRFGNWTNNQELNGLGGYFTPSLYDPTKGSFLDPGTYQQRQRRVLRRHRLRAAPASCRTASPFALPRVNVAWDIDGEGNNVVRGGYGMFYNRNMGNVEYDNTLRLRAERLPGRHRLLGRRRLRQRRRADLRHGARGDAGQPHRQHRHQLADAGLVQVAEDAQLQRVVRAADPVEPGRRGELRRHARPRPGEPQQRQRDAVRRAELRHLQRRRPVGAGQPRRGRERRRQPRHVPAVQRARAASRSTTSDGVSNYDSMQLTLSRQTGRRLQYFVAYTLGADRGHARRRVLATSIPYDPSRTYGVLDEDRTHVLNVSWNAFLPDGAKGAHGQRRRPRAPQRLAALGHLVAGERHPDPARASRATPASSRRRAGLLRHGRRRRTEQHAAATASRRSTPATRRSAAARSARRSSTSTASRCRSSARTATWCRRTTSGRRRASNHDLTLFKNFAIKGDQKLQFRVGFFNLFNQAFANTNIGGRHQPDARHGLQRVA